MAGGTWIKSPRGAPSPGTCCECKANVCDQCGGCGTPEVCYTEIDAGDSTVLCGQIICAATPPPFSGLIGFGQNSASHGIIKICGTPSACTLKIKFNNNGELGFEETTLGMRGVSVIVDGVPMFLLYSLDTEVNAWDGNTTISLGLGVCVNIEWELSGQAELSFWSIIIECVP